MTMKKELKISVNNALAAYNHTDANGKELLEHLFGKEIFAQDIKDKVKTFVDAMEALGQGNPLVEEYIAVRDKLRTDAGELIAYLKLRVIVAALNEGWEPKFDGDECRYYPWFYIYTKKEYEKLDEYNKEECRVFGRSAYNARSNYVFVDAKANGTSTCSYTDCCSRLAFKTKELAEYCGKQFIDIWEKFLFE